MWPLMVRSSSPSSQSQTLIVVSSDAEAREENMGWKAIDVTGRRWDCNVCLAGDRGSQVVGSTFRRDESGVFESSSLCRAVFFDSRSIIFFWRRTTLVHFFSSRPSYFLAEAASKFGPICISSLNASALFDRPIDDR